MPNMLGSIVGYNNEKQKLLMIYFLGCMCVMLNIEPKTLSMLDKLPISFQLSVGKKEADFLKLW